MSVFPCFFTIFTYMHADSQIGQPAGRQAGRQRGTQTNRHVHTDMHMHICMYMYMFLYPNVFCFTHFSSECHFVKLDTNDNKRIYE